MTVVGAVQEAGHLRTAGRQQRLLRALVAAGGLTEKASTIVEIRSLAGQPGRPAGRATRIRGGPWPRAARCAST